MEAGVVINLKGEALHWHLPRGRTAGSLPDSRNLWDVLWENRENILGFAHSHPGGGIPGPSWTDLTTFAAVESGLGRRLDWWITSDESIVVLRWKGPGQHDYERQQVTEPSWAGELRRVSVPL